jgi:hypothetical protein
MQQVYQLKKISNVQKLVIYDIDGHSAIDILERGIVYSFMDSTLKHDAGSINFHIHTNRLASHMKHLVSGDGLEITSSVKGGVVIKRNAISLFWIREKSHVTPANVKFDFIVISNNAITSLEKIKPMGTRIIIDSSNSSYLGKKLTSQAKKLGLEVHNTHTLGAFVFEQNIE